MKIFRVLLLMTVLLTLATSASAKLKGIGLGAGAHDGDFGFQVRKDFWLGGDISRITGQASLFFHGTTTFKLDADYHFIINPDSPGRFYPLAGLQLAFNSDDVQFGLNGGGGMNFMFTETTAAFAELKYVFGDWDGLAIIGGIYF